MRIGTEEGDIVQTVPARAATAWTAAEADDAGSADAAVEEVDAGVPSHRNRNAAASTSGARASFTAVRWFCCAEEEDDDDEASSTSLRSAARGLVEGGPGV